MSAQTRSLREPGSPRGIKKRLIALLSVLLMALGFSGLSVLPAAATQSGEEAEEENAEEAQADTEEETSGAEEEDDYDGESNAAADTALADEEEAEELEVSAPVEDSSEAEEAPVELSALETPAEEPQLEEPEDTETAPADVIQVDDDVEVESAIQQNLSVAEEHVEEELVDEPALETEPEVALLSPEAPEEDSTAVSDDAEGDLSETLEEETADSPSDYDPQLTFYSSPELSEWLIAREGIAVTGWGFPAGAEVTATVGSDVVGTAVADQSGEVGFTVISELTVGTYPLTLSAEAGSVSAEIEVIADEDYYSDEDEAEGLEVHVSMNTASVSEVEAGDLMLRPTGFPTGPADLYLNGELHEGSVNSRDDFALSGIGPGDYTAVYRMGAYEAAVSFVVVPDEQGEIPVPGGYQGESVTLDGDLIPLTIEVDENGVLTSFSAPRMYACVSHEGGSIDPMEFDWSSIPPTPITVGQPFEIRWGATESWQNLVVSGVINADGSASGEAKWENLCRGGIQDTWTAQIDGVLPDPEPTPEPEPTPDPTDPAPTEDPEPSPEPTPDPTDDPTDPAPTEEPTAEPTDPAPSVEPTQEPTEEPTSDPSDPAPSEEPTSDPTSDPASEPTGPAPSEDPSTEPTEEPTEDSPADPSPTESESTSPEDNDDDSGDSSTGTTEDGAADDDEDSASTSTDDDDEDADEGSTTGGASGSDDSSTSSSGADGPAPGDDTTTGGDSDGTSTSTGSGDEEDGTTGADEAEASSNSESDSSEGGLASTGATTWAVAGLALLLTATGAAAFWLSRRRTQ